MQNLHSGALPRTPRFNALRSLIKQRKRPTKNAGLSTTLTRCSGRSAALPYPPVSKIFLYGIGGGLCSSPLFKLSLTWGTPQGRLAQASRGREVRSKIERTAQAILDARALYPDSSLADLYDEVTMPPELRRAHQNNDRAVMEAYGFDWRNMTESECVAELFKLYSKLVDEEKATVAPARRKRSTRSRVAPSGGESGD